MSNLKTTPDTTVQATGVSLASLDEMRHRIRQKSKLKGRQADKASLDEICALIGDKPAGGHRRDLLIERLHKLNDDYRCLHDRHIAALNKEMNIPMVEVCWAPTLLHVREGWNPAMSNPDLNHARYALASLEHQMVRVIFMTETAWLDDLVLPATAWPEKTGTVSNTDRMVQSGKQAIDPPSDAKPDLWIIQEIAKRLDLSWNYPGVHHGVAAFYEEMRLAMHASISGITWERLERESSVTYPCLSADDAESSSAGRD